MSLRSYLIDAARYWERKRLSYNLILTTLAVVCWGPEIFLGGPRAWLGGGLVLFAFAVIANLFFCLTYPVDLALQLSPFRSFWIRTRWVLFSVGLVLASSLALWVMLHDGMA